MTGSVGSAVEIAGPGAAASAARTVRPSWVALVAAAAVVAAFAFAVMAGSDRIVVGLLAMAMMLALLFLKVPIGMALIVPGVVGLWGIAGWRAVRGALATLTYSTAANWSLSVLPMFVFMGLLLWRSGVTDKLYVAARNWVGSLPGGLAIGTNLAGAGLAAISGSTAATTYALARISIPEMLRAGYHRRMAIAAVISAGMSGQLIPPSVLLVVYSGIAGVAVGPQLAAGIVPGILVAVSFAILLFAVCSIWPTLAGTSRVDTPVRWGERWRSLVGVWHVPLLIALVLGCMFSGLLTTTEAGAAGAAGALLIVFWERRRSGAIRQVVARSTIETVGTVGAIFLLLVGAYMLTRLLAVSGIGQLVTDWIIDADLSRVPFLFIMVVVYLLLGTFMEPLPMMLLTVPLLIPVLEALEISLLWFGVFIVFMGELAIVSPPVGVLAYIIYAITQEPEVNHGQRITLGDTFVAALYFVPACIAVCAVLIYFPEVVTWLPDQLALPGE